MFSQKFNKGSSRLLLVTAGTIVGTAAGIATVGAVIAFGDAPGPEAEQAREAAKIRTDLERCVVRVHNSPTFYGAYNAYDYRHGLIHFNVTSGTKATSVSFKDLAEDGQVRVAELFSHLKGTNCKAPKFG